jgi:putative inorganic carbon (hco3(-)) transporter
LFKKVFVDKPEKPLLHKLSMLNTVLAFIAIIIAFLESGAIYLHLNIHDLNALIAFLLLTIGSMVFILRKGKESCRISGLAIALFLFFLYSASSFYFSSNADLSGYPAFKFLNALFLATALLVLIDDIKILKKSLTLIFIFAGIHAGFGVLQQIMPSLLNNPEKFSSVSSSLFANPNFYSGYLVIHIPIGFLLLSQYKSAFHKNAIHFILVLIWVALGLSGSPGGELIALLMILATIGYMLKTKATQELKALGWTLVFALLLYFSLKNLFHQSPVSQSDTLASAWVARPWVWEHIENRFMYWTGAWSIFLEHWIWGSGLWTFLELYPQTGLNYTPPHAHNMYLQTLAETGLLGFGFLTVCLYHLIKTSMRTFKDRNADTKKYNFYISLSLSGLLLHNLIEYNWLTSNFIYYFTFLVVSIDILNRETSSRSTCFVIQNKKWLMTTGVIIFLALGAFTLSQYYRYQRVMSEDIPASATIEELAVNVERAIDHCSHCGGPHYLSGFINLQEYYRTKDIQYLAHAEIEINEVIRLNPNGMGMYLLLGEIKGTQGNNLEAISHYKKAMKDSRFKNAALEGLNNLKKKQSRSQP